jgi:hypothetical protein
MVELYVVGAFVALMAVLVVRAKLRGGWTFLDTFALRPDEVEVFREDPSLVEERVVYAPTGAFGNKFGRLPASRVVLTNQRLLIAVKGLGSPRYILRAIFELTGHTDTPAPLGGQVYTISRSALEADDSLLRVTTPTTIWQIHTPSPARYLEAPTTA